MENELKTRNHIQLFYLPRGSFVIHMHQHILKLSHCYFSIPPIAALILNCRSCSTRFDLSHVYLYINDREALRQLVHLSCQLISRLAIDPNAENILWIPMPRDRPPLKLPRRHRSSYKVLLYGSVLSAGETGGTSS